MFDKDLQYQIYKFDDENEINALVKDDTIWLTQKSIGELFGVGIPAVSKHLTNIFECGELQEEVVISILETTTQHGALADKTQTKPVKFYNLDAIISVGYRVNSLKATRFRQWATKVLREYMIKGFVLNDERLKQGEKIFGKDYFKELLERVRSIRASERRIYLQLTDVFAEISIDYDPKSQLTREFYAMVQNKFHYAITGYTAAEIIHGRADRNKAKMGLLSYKNAPDGRVLKSDVTVAKNYLDERELRRLERNVSGFFDYVEGLIEDGHLFTMNDFAKSIDEFLKFNRFDILTHKGKISKYEAEEKAHIEYDAFNKTQKINSDFEKQIKKLGEESSNRLS